MSGAARAPPVDDLDDGDELSSGGGGGRQSDTQSMDSGASAAAQAPGLSGATAAPVQEDVYDVDATGAESFLDLPPPPPEEDEED